MLTLTDLFCGAGGSSTGAIQVPNVSVRAASNHWALAVETHNSNHPDAAHICADLSQIDPRYFPTSDILWASPECTSHSIARGKKYGSVPDLFGDTLPDEAAERSRATMWDVVRFTEAHQYQAVIVENVVDAVRWSPWRAWLLAMDSLGYEHTVIMLNSMHAQLAGPGAPQSRDRLYVAFWRKGNRRPDFERITRPKAVCPTCGPVLAVQAFKRHDQPQVGRYKAQYVYRCPNVACRNQVVEPTVRPAAEIIDWSLQGQRIGDRTRPLAEKTMRRIRAGIERYWSPLTVEAAGNTYDAADPKHPRYGKAGAYMRAWPAAEPLRTVHTTMSKALAIPGQERAGKAPQTVSAQGRTKTPRNEAGVAFMAELRGGGSKHRPVTSPLSTVTASGQHHGLVTPAGGTWREQATSTASPLPTRTTRETDGLATGRPGVNIDDVRFRMLEPREIIRAMDFPESYQVLGNRREQVRMAGNAVTPPAARDLVSVVAESLH